MQKKLLSIILIVTLFVTQFSAIEIFAATHVHSYTIPATCTSPKKCSCGATSGSALGHNISGQSDTYSSTHPHYAYRNCSRCQASIQMSYRGNWCSCCSQCPHTWSAWSTAATAHPHNQKRTCSVCAKSDTQTTTNSNCCSCVGHNYSIYVSTSSSHTSGLGHATTYKCSRCTSTTTSYTTNYSGCCQCGYHDWPNSATLSSTHESGGHRFYQYCTKCNLSRVCSWDSGYHSSSSCSICHTHSHSTKIYGSHTSTGHDTYMQCSCGSSYATGNKEANPNCLSCTTAPYVALVNITADTCLSEADTDFKVQINVKDNENDTLTCKYYLDGATTPTGTETVTQTSQTKLVTFTTGINASTLSSGLHQIKIEVKDSIAPAGAVSINFSVDKAGPVFSTLNVTPTENGSNIVVGASDAPAGLDETAYRYTIGTNVSSWVSKSSWLSSTDMGLTLAPNTSYPYSVEVKDKKGHITKVDGTFRTKSEVPVVSTISNSNSTIDVNISDNNPSGTEYQIKIGTKYVAADGILVDAVNPNEENWLKLDDKRMCVIGLLPETTYIISVKSRNGNGIPSEASLSSSTSTLPLPLSKPINIESVNTSKTSITLKWDATARATDYDVEMDGNTSDFINLNLNSFTQNGLQPASTHVFRVRANIGSVKGEWSDIIQATTLPNPPKQIDTSSITSQVSGSAIVFKWSAVATCDSYQVELNNSNSYYTSTQPSITIPFSQYDAQYTIRIRGCNAGGNGEWSATPYITYTPANIPENVTVSGITYNTVSASWQVNQNPASIKYKIGVFDSSNGLVKEGSFTNAAQASISGLEGNTTYILKVKSVNSIGLETAWTEGVEFKTKINPPATPEQVCATAKDKQISIFWGSADRAETYTIKRNDVVIASNLSQPNFTDTGLLPETNYSYEVQAINSSGVSTWSIPLVKSTLGSMPDVPAKLETTPSNVSININWNAVANVTGYEIEVDGNVVSTDSSTIYIHNGLLPGTYHTYRVRARNLNGRSDWSQLATVKTIPNAPAIPEGVVTTATDTTLEITWNASADANKYEVEIDGIVYKDVTSNRYTLSGLTPKSQHNFRICAVNEGGSSQWTQLENITLEDTPTSAPSVKGTATSNTITISWNSIDNANGYEVTDELGTIVTSTTVAEITQYQVNGLMQGETHTYKVRAVFDSTTGEWSIPYTITTIPEVPVLNCVAQQSYMLLQWPISKGATIYQLEADGTVIYTGSSPSYLNTSLQPNSQHSYRVRAGNESGYSAWSEIATFKTSKEITNIPQVLVQSKLNNNTIVVSWEPVEGVTAYKIKINGVEQNQSQSQPSVNVTTTPGAIYTVCVASITDIQAGTIGEWSDELTFRAPYAAPIAPTIGKTNSSTSAIELNWNAAESSTGYEVDADGKILDVGNVYKYIDTGLQPESSHKYRVRGYNESGKGLWSDTVTTSTDVDLPGAPLYIICNNEAVTTGVAIKINWKAVEGATSYEIANGEGNIVNTTDSAITIDNLKHGATYKFKVRAITEAGTGPWSSTVQCTTLLEIPKNIVATSTNGAISLSWDAVEGATQYDVEMDGSIIGTTTDSAISITQGSVYMTHKFRVLAKNSVQAGNWSETIEYNQNVPVSFEVTQGEEFTLSIPVSDVTNINQYRLSLTLNKEDVELLDACELTPEAETYTKFIQENSMQLVIEDNTNTINVVMALKVTPSEGYEYSGIINSLKLRSKKNGTITVNFKVDCLQ